MDYLCIHFDKLLKTVQKESNDFFLLFKDHNEKNRNCFSKLDANIIHMALFSFFFTYAVVLPKTCKAHFSEFISIGCLHSLIFLNISFKQETNKRQYQRHLLTVTFPVHWCCSEVT